MATDACTYLVTTAYCFFLLSGGPAVGFPFVKLGTHSTVTLERGDDVTSKYIHINYLFPLGSPSSIFTRAFVSNNGIVSFGHPCKSPYPRTFPVLTEPPLVAAFWSDTDTRLAGHVRYRVYHELDSYSWSVLGSINKYVNSVVKDEHHSYVARWALVTEWKDVHQYPHGLNINDDPSDPTNTFQCLVFTDCCITYAMFTYGCGSLGWSARSKRLMPRIGVSTPQGHFQSAIFEEDVAVELNRLACNSSDQHYNLLYQIGFQQMSHNCEFHLEPVSHGQTPVFNKSEYNESF